MRKKGMKNTALLMAFMVGTSIISPVSLKAEEQVVSDVVINVDGENELINDDLLGDEIVTDDISSESEEVNAEIEMQKDEDGDGLQDYLETYFGTDLAKKDTDEDGISDYLEIAKLKTDPLVADSNLDSDGDGLSNLYEIILGTEPTKADTDDDGLNDYDEVNKYKTSPVKEDSDGDGLLDSEEIELNLSPFKRFTKAKVNDFKKLFSQELSLENIEEVLLGSENLAIPSLSGDLPGLMKKRVYIESSTVVLDDMESYVIGTPIEVVSQYEDGTVNMKLSFRCPKSTLKQVKNYKIAHYKDGQITYLNTNLLLKKVSAKISEGGTYFVADPSKAPVKAFAVTNTQTDTDYDGIPDASDPTPNNNSFSGTMKNNGFPINSKVDYAIDYRAFFKTPSTFNSQLCKASSIYAAMSYGFTMEDTASKKSLSMEDLMRYQGLSDVTPYNLESYYSDDHVTKFFIGHRTVTVGSTTKDIIAVAIQGTGGGIKQWASNFDIGTTTTYSKYADWTDSTNHKGFDMAATRTKKLVEDYVAKKCSGSNQKVYWITGHSRGAAISNILAAKLQDSGKTTYTYTFATPKTTTKSASVAGKYTSIFNIINKDDFVPCLPCSVWGFRLYGKTSTESIAAKYEKEWESFTGINDYNPDTIGMDDTISKLGGVCANRNKAYVYTCSDHGDGSKNDITITNRGMSKDSREGAIAKIPANCLPYCAITRHNGKAFWGWDFDVCQTPCYFMQDIAAFLAGEINTYRFVVELNIAKHYESAKTALISSGIGGLEHPHYSESYVILAKHATASNFS